MVRIRSGIVISTVLGTAESGYVSSAFSRNSEVLPLTEHQKSAIVKAHNVYRKRLILQFQKVSYEFNENSYELLLGCKIVTKLRNKTQAP